MVGRKVTIKVLNTGVNFGCYAVIRDLQRHKLAETRVYPYGQRGNAYAGAEIIAAERGWEVQKDEKSED